MLIARFFQLYEQLIRQSLDPEEPEKCPGIDALSIWLQRATQMLQVDSSLAGNFQQLFSDRDVETIFTYICDFWTDSGAAVGNALRELFLKTIIFLKKIRSTESCNTVLCCWMERLLALPKKMRILYFGLENLSNDVGGSFILSKCPSLPTEGFLLMSENGLSSAISRGLNALFTSLRREPYQDRSAWLLTWAEPMLDTIIESPGAYQNIQSYFLPLILKTNPDIFPLLAEYVEKRLSHNVDQCLEVLADCTTISLSHGINKDYHTNKDNGLLIERLIQHESSALRVSGMGLIAADQRGSSPVGKHEMAIILSNMDCIFFETDPRFRNKILGFFRNIVSRIRGTSYALHRDLRKSQKWALARGDTESAQAVSEKAKSVDEEIFSIKQFFDALCDYFLKSIAPGSPYQCQISALLAVRILLQSGLDTRVPTVYFEKTYVSYEFEYQVLTENFVNSLIDNVMNNYEDVRILSLEMIQLCPEILTGLRMNGTLARTKTRTYEMLSGIRGREGDGGARLAELVFSLYDEDGASYLNELCDKLEFAIQMADENIFEGVLRYPVHGYFLSLQLILSSVDYDKHTSIDSAFISRLSRSIVKIWHSVKYILSHESPEGNIPPEFATRYTKVLEKQYGPAAQVVLSYGWRSIKESSELLCVILSKAPSALLSDAFILEHGSLILDQLSTVKHRGAFSSLYPTFLACCKRCLTRESLSAQPFTWLDENILLIKQKAQYVTRRSSGLPFLIVAVLASVPVSQRKGLFADTFQKLISIAHEEVTTVDGKTDLPQVHAFNCIKVLFTDAELNSISLPYIDSALELAITSFAHDVWSIRNCAVMLYTALQNRLFGHHNEGFMSAKLFFLRHHKVHSVLLQQLRHHVGQLENNDGDFDKHIEIVYPVLSLLTKLKGVSGYDGLDEFIPLVLLCLGSRIWKIREVSARALGSMVVFDHVIDLISDLARFSSTEDQNLLHGNCLAMIALRPAAEAATISSKLKDLFTIKADELLFSNNCPETRLAFFRCMRLYCPESAALEGFRIKEITFPYPERQTPSSAERYYRSEVAEYALTYSPDVASLLVSLLNDYAYEVKLVALEYIEKNTRSIRESSENAIVICNSLWKLFNQYSWDKVRGFAIRMFSHLVKIEENEDLLSMWHTLYDSVSTSSTDEVNNSCLETLGPLTCLLADDQLFDKWMQLILKFSGDYEEYTTRQAALNSLINYLKSLRASESAPSPVYMALYNFLYDDDSDIRDAATSMANSCLNTVAKCNLYCAKNLLSKISKAQGGRDVIIGYLLKTPFNQQIDTAWKLDDLLFSIEKQNLYRFDYSLLEDCLTEIARTSLSAQEKGTIRAWLDKDGALERYHSIRNENENKNRESWPAFNTEERYLVTKVDQLLQLL